MGVRLEPAFAQARKSTETSEIISVVRNAG